ncbi:MAG: hypothetical protein ACF8XB_18385 [Planctomycetota bacterium JB042]
MSRIAARLKHEFLAVLPPTLFFFVSFQVIAFTKALMLEQYGVRVTTFVTATIAALVVGKVVLLVDLIPFVNRFPHKPLAWNVVWKTALYMLAALLVRYVEHLIDFLRDGEGLAAANRRLIDEVVWPHFWAVQIWLLVLFLVYCAVREVGRALGRERVTAMFFGAPPPA